MAAGAEPGDWPGNPGSEGWLTGGVGRVFGRGNGVGLGVEAGKAAGRGGTGLREGTAAGGKGAFGNATAGPGVASPVGKDGAVEIANAGRVAGASGIVTGVVRGDVAGG